MSASSERVADWLHDIVENADAIDAYLEGVSADAYRQDRKTRDAVERCLERIAEAAIRIGEERFAELVPTVSLHTLRGLGNTLRHGYDRIAEERIYRTGREDVPELRAACIAALRALEG